MSPANEPDLLDRHNRIMAAILTRFRNMVLAATEPLPTAAAIPQASLNSMTMNNEVSALVCRYLSGTLTHDSPSSHSPALHSLPISISAFIFSHSPNLVSPVTLDSHSLRLKMSRNPAPNLPSIDQRNRKLARPQPRDQAAVDRWSLAQAR